MNKMFFLWLLLFSVSSFAMIVPRTEISYLSLENDSVWELKLYNEEVYPEILQLESFSDSVAFDCTAITADILDEVDYNYYLHISSDGTGITIKIKDSYTSKVFEILATDQKFKLSPQTDSLQVYFTCNNRKYSDSFWFGGESYFPSLTKGRAFHKDDFCSFTSYWYTGYNKPGNYPVAIKGKVYGHDGELLKNDVLYYSIDYENGGPCRSTTANINENGEYTISFPYYNEQGLIVSKLWYFSSEKHIAPINASIEPIDLRGLPFGSIVEADIHFLDELTAIDEQITELFWLNDGKLHFSEEVSKGELVDMQGRSILSGADCLSLANLPAGMYCMKAELMNGKQVCQKLYIH